MVSSEQLVLVRPITFRAAATGVVSYVGKSKAIFTTHPIEKPYLIYQIGSSDPEFAVKAAKTVMQDVAGFDLNCGCPKPFSTHSGMGAALLTNPDLLCGILTALRAAIPRTHSLSAKIRLLPTQEDTLKLVERIVDRARRGRLPLLDGGTASRSTDGRHFEER